MMPKMNRKSYKFGRSPKRCPSPKARLDSIKHFPFVDEEGTMDSVLHSYQKNKLRFSRMGSPARRRLCLSVFDEITHGQMRMRVADIADALKVCLIIAKVILSLGKYLRLLDLISSIVVYARHCI
jgi:hypothetical protein